MYFPLPYCPVNNYKFVIINRKILQNQIAYILTMFKSLHLNLSLLSWQEVMPSHLSALHLKD